ncbi:MAG: hypothetical protein MZV65_31390 [Chromatiales bacterium]|nr:hypothetical protein [Chromatiales bacterium]
MRVRVLASVMGEQGLPDTDRSFLAFGEPLRGASSCSQAAARTLEESMATGWARAARPAAHRADAAVGRADQAPPRGAGACLKAAKSSPTRVAFLELKDERRLVQEGYELLDEKRVLLATEILRQLRALRRAAQDELARLERGARSRRSRPRSACHGFDDLTVEPKLDLGPALLRRARAVVPRPARWWRPRSRTRAPPTPTRRPCRRRRRPARCAARVPRPGRRARRAGRLRRQPAAADRASTVRTERRARALENVVLPEIDESLRFIEEQLDAVDQEEAVRVRNAARGVDPATRRRA